ncbi:MAG TPA: NAD-dependent epimerase/dehydratase family protein [Lacunisphaera sp.]|jgi:nucleoside-diphosphate-sugar epimerase|nr:NAD-dependent epimerase/dehydratase family protein [Lacunisphaera sp.]
MNGTAFVTGASGFIGGKLVERLLAAGRRVRALSRRPLPELTARGAEVIVGDLDNLAGLVQGCTGATTVFHVAGRVGVWGPASEFFHVNVEGTGNVIVACRAARVPRLVYTSSPSVVYQGGDLAGVDESAPLCTAAPCAYPTSKAAAERLVRVAHGPDLATVSLRPHLVWGPGDKNVVPRVLALARQGRLKIIGRGRNRVDVTHITNVVDAHLLAEQALINGGGVASLHAAGGQAYFITNGEPVVLWDWINRLLRGVGLPPITSHVSLAAAYAAGGIMEALWRVLPLKGEPPMTRFVAKEMATDHWFNISAARRDLGYSPRVTVDEGTQELIANLKREA